MRYAIAILGLLALLLLASATPVLCAEKPGKGPVIQQLAGGYQWELRHFAEGDELLLFRVTPNGAWIHCGNYRCKDGRYWSWLGLSPTGEKLWIRDVDPPAALPPGYQITKNFGMQWSPRARDENVLHFGGGKQPDVKKVIKASGDASEVPNYNGMWSVTVVSTDDARRKQVVDDLAKHPALGRWQHERIKEYAPDSWALKPFKLDEDTSFQSSGLVTLVSPPCDANFKAPIEAVYGYAGAEDLASRLRDIEARYNPNVHSGGSHAGLSPLAAAAVSGIGVGVFCLVVCAAVLAAVVLLMKRPKPPEEEEMPS